MAAATFERWYGPKLLERIPGAREGRDDGLGPRVQLASEALGFAQTVRAGPLPPVDPASQLLSGGALIPAQSASRCTERLELTVDVRELLPSTLELGHERIVSRF